MNSKVIHGTHDEFDERVDVKLSNPVCVTIPASLQLPAIRLTDDDPPPMVGIAPPLTVSVNPVGGQGRGGLQHHRAICHEPGHARNGIHCFLRQREGGHIHRPDVGKYHNPDQRRKRG